MMMYQYPTLREFISESFRTNREEELLDFLFDIEINGSYQTGH